MYSFSKPWKSKNSNNYLACFLTNRLIEISNGNSMSKGFFDLETPKILVNIKRFVLFVRLQQVVPKDYNKIERKKWDETFPLKVVAISTELKMYQKPWHLLLESPLFDVRCLSILLCLWLVFVQIISMLKNSECWNCPLLLSYSWFVLMIPVICSLWNQVQQSLVHICLE